MLDHGGVQEGILRGCQGPHRRSDKVGLCIDSKNGGYRDLEIRAAGEMGLRP